MTLRPLLPTDLDFFEVGDIPRTDFKGESSSSSSSSLVYDFLRIDDPLLRRTWPLNSPIMPESEGGGGGE